MAQTSDFSDGQVTTLVSLNIVFAVFSFLGSAFIIFMYWKAVQLRSFAFRLVFWISVSDCLYALGDFLGDQGDRTFGCVLQALLISYFELTSLFWTVMIAYTLHMLILKHKSVDQIELQSKFYHYICWGVPAVLTLLPFTTDSYGDAAGWCWITVDRNANAGTAWRFIQFYIPLWLGFIYNTWVYAKVTDLIKLMQQQAVAPAASDEVKVMQSSVHVDDEPELAQPEDPDHEAAVPAAPRSGGSMASSASTLDRVKYYPMVLLVCYFWASVNRIMQIFGPPVFWVTVLHTIGAASQGTLNAFVYGLTPSVRSAGAEILRGYGLCLPRHEFARTETSSSNAPATSAKSAAVDDSESAHPVAVADSFR